MTAEQCACRQAEHENLIRELVSALVGAAEHLDWIGWGDRYERDCAAEAGLQNRVGSAIEKAKEQGYA